MKVSSSRSGGLGLGLLFWVVASFFFASDVTEGYLMTNNFGQQRKLSFAISRPAVVTTAISTPMAHPLNAVNDGHSDDSSRTSADIQKKDNSVALNGKNLPRHLVTAALVGLLWVVPPSISSTTSTATPSMAAWAIAQTPSLVLEVEKSPTPPKEKQQLDEARAALQTATTDAKKYVTELELAKIDLGSATRASAKAEQTAEKILKTVDAEVAKLGSLKKTGDRDIIVTQKDKVAAVKEKLSEAQEVLRSAKKVEGQNRAKVDSITSALKQAENTKEQSKKDIAKYEKSFKQYLEKEKKMKDQQTKARQEAIRKASEEKKKEAEIARKKEKEQKEKEKKQAEKEKEQRVKELKARQEAAKKKAIEDKKQAEKRAQQEKQKKELAKKKAEEARKKQIAAEKKAQEDAKKAAKKAAEERKKKMAALKSKISKLEEQKGDLIVKDAPNSKINALEQKITAAKEELKSLSSKK